MGEFSVFEIPTQGNSTHCTYFTLVLGKPSCTNLLKLKVFWVTSRPPILCRILQIPYRPGIYNLSISEVLAVVASEEYNRHELDFLLHIFAR